MKEFTCVSCPMGCRLRAIETANGYTIEGYTCKRGLEYGLQEMKDPRRNISTTVKVKDGFLAVLPVKTSKPIPKDMIFTVMHEINKKEVQAPVAAGTCIIPNVLNTGADIIATRTMPAK